MPRKSRRRSTGVVSTRGPIVRVSNSTSCSCVAMEAPQAQRRTEAPHSTAVQTLCKKCGIQVQQRFKGVGMRWSEDGFNHLLHLRLAWVNGTFETLFQVQRQPSPNT